MSRRNLWMLALAAMICTTSLTAAFKGARYTARRAGTAGKTSEKDKVAAADSRAVEFQVTSEEAFPVRALDPVLYVGGIEVRDYRYGDMENTTLIFTCYEPDKLEESVAVYLQYDNDTRTRTDLPAFRWAMVK